MRDNKFCWVLLTALFLLVSTGCSPALIPMDKDEMARLKSEPQIRVVTYQPPQFMYQMPANLFAPGAAGALNPATGGLAVGTTAYPQGQVFMLASSLEDPVVQVKDTFVHGLVGHLDVTRLTHVQDVLADDDIRALEKRFGSGVVLDFKTDNWGLLSGPLVTLPYQAVYIARSRLMRLGDGRVLWQAYCQYRANLDQFKANSTPALRERFAEAAETCAQTLLAQFFNQSK